MPEDDVEQERERLESSEASQDDDAGSFEEEISPATEQLEEFVRSDGAGLLNMVLDRHLSGPLTEQTFKITRDAGMLVMGEAGFGLISWVSSNPDRAAALETLDLSQEAKSWLTGIVALYGDRLNDALHMSDVIASRKDDWEAFGRRIRVDPRSGDFEITTEIQKFNGEKLTLQAGLPSAVRLAERVLATLISVDDLSSVEDDDRQDLLDALEAVRERLVGAG